jgi:hypothetical protein
MAIRMIAHLTLFCTIRFIFDKVWSTMDNVFMRLFTHSNHVPDLPVIAHVLNSRHLCFFPCISRTHGFNTTVTYLNLKILLKL